MISHRPCHFLLTELWLFQPACNWSDFICEISLLYCIYTYILWLFQKISLWKELTPFQEGEGNLIYFRCPKGTKFISVEFVFKSTASVNPLLLHHINQDDQSTLMATTYISSLFMFCGLAFSKTPKGVLKIALMSRQHQLVKFYVPMSEKGGCNFGLSFQLSEGGGRVQLSLDVIREGRANFLYRIAILE